MKVTGLSAACLLAMLSGSCNNLTELDSAPRVWSVAGHAGGEPLPVQVADTVKMMEVKGGKYVPFYGGKDSAVAIKTFEMDAHPVTNRQFQTFIQHNRPWRRSCVKRIFADGNYLAGWENDTTPGPNLLPDAPVTNVSWFAAKAYAAAAGKRLPTVAEWEYAAMAGTNSADARTQPAFNAHILSWYEKPNTAGNAVQQSRPNYWGIHDLHGLVWEWTEDFSEVMLSGESRRDVSNDDLMFCGSGSVGASDLMNYAAFMRFAFRGSLKANYCIRNQGFRCVKSENQTKNEK
ncbi:formylglycine-generating enzyme family protein [Chitinophaga sp. NPDC101104]|uniref:formylglycine-generating enzyme family protein n=1 Tax=Chitinophaga sp. NPDC101104 TaxID=3390561 RepID=UPI003D0590F5